MDELSPYPQFLADPSGSSPFTSAAHWVQALLAGSLASTLAVLAVAWFGFALLDGRTDIRRGARLLLGCFIVFGASTIASGLLTLAGTSAMATQGDQRASSTARSPLPISPTPAPNDPYAGISVLHNH